MTTRIRRGFSFWAVQGPGWLLLIYLIVAQGITAFSYDLGVAMGTQEPAELITEVGTAFWYGFAFADLVIYIPLLLAGLNRWLIKRHNPARSINWVLLERTFACVASKPNRLIPVSMWMPALCLPSQASAHSFNWSGLTRQGRRLWVM